MKVLYLTHLSGGIGNKLINLYHWQALAQSYGYALVPCVFGFESCFVGTRKHLFSRYVLFHSLVRTVKHIEIPPPFANQAEEIIKEALESGKSVNIGLHNWLPEGLRGREISDEAARKYFTPTSRYMREAKATAKTARSEGKLLVGVHIRHGDFAHHDGGKWFVTLETVIENMNRFREIAGETSFIVCSDTHFEAKDFPNLDVTFGPGHMVSDMTALSMCDYILKPAYSTFGLWAAWWGKTPCLPMQSQPHFELKDFQVPTLDPFADSRDLL